MDNVHYVTYATHPQGMFNELINNPHGVKIDVLGWGEKWNGFMDKYIGMGKYLETIPPDDYVVFLDGFDTRVNRSPTDIISIFNSYGCQILASREAEIITKFNNLTKEYNRRRFGSCGDHTANSGMWMAKVSDARTFIKESVDDWGGESADDQVAMNNVCRKMHKGFICIEDRRLIFTNSYTFGGKCESIFCSYPATAVGGGKIARVKRKSILLFQIYKAFSPQIYFFALLVAALYILKSFPSKPVKRR